MKASKRRYNERIGNLLFILPAVIIIILVVYAYVQLNSPGTLMVQAETANGTLLNVQATVNGKTITTPTTLSLAQGSYTVDFATITWYYPPTPRDVVVSPGKTTYAVGSYQPETKFIQVTKSGFNVTSVSVLHDVTPVNWTNPSGSTVAITGGPVSRVSIVAGGSYVYVFPTAGNYTLTIVSSNESMVVQVE